MGRLVLELHDLVHVPVVLVLEAQHPVVDVEMDPGSRHGTVQPFVQLPLLLELGQHLGILVVTGQVIQTRANADERFDVVGKLVLQVDEGVEGDEIEVGLDLQVFITLGAVDQRMPFAPAVDVAQVGADTPVLVDQVIDAGNGGHAGIPLVQLGLVQGRDVAVEPGDDRPRLQGDDLAPGQGNAEKKDQDSEDGTVHCNTV